MIMGWVVMGRRLFWRRENWKRCKIVRTLKITRPIRMFLTFKIVITFITTVLSTTTPHTMTTCTHMSCYCTACIMMMRSLIHITVIIIKTFNCYIISKKLTISKRWNAPMIIIILLPQEQQQKIRQNQYQSRESCWCC